MFIHADTLIFSNLLCPALIIQLFKQMHNSIFPEIRNAGLCIYTEFSNARYSASAHSAFVDKTTIRQSLLHLVSNTITITYKCT